MNRKTIKSQGDKYTVPAFNRPRVVDARRKDGVQKEKNMNGVSGGGSFHRSGIKTSTPNKDESKNVLDVTNVSNISFIRPSASCNVLQSLARDSNLLSPSMASRRGTLSRSITAPGGEGCSGIRSRPGIKNPTKKESKAVVSKEDQILGSGFNELIQSEIFDKISDDVIDRNEDEIDRQLASLQKRIIQNQEILNKARESIKQININRDIESLMKEVKTDFKNVANSVSRSNMSNSERNKAVAKELERMRNKLACENIVIPQTTPGLTKLHETLKDTVTAFEKLSKESFDTLNENKELSESLKQFDSGHEQVNTTQNSCCQIALTLNSYVAENCSKKIYKEDSSIREEQVPE